MSTDLDLKGFNTLLQLNVNAKTDTKGVGKNALKYLSWSEAWTEFVKVYPSAIYEIVKNEKNLPYFADETGAIVYVRVTANDLTHEMWLPVMDSSNKAMKSIPSSYQVKEYSYDQNQRKNVATGKMIDKTVEAYTMFDINKTVMRCLTKCLAMFGLGLYIYNKEDLPEVIPEPIKTVTNEMVLELEELIIKAAVDKNRFLIAFNIKKLEDMPMNHFANAIKSLRAKLEKSK